MCNALRYLRDAKVLKNPVAPFAKFYTHTSKIFNRNSNYSILQSITVSLQQFDQILLLVREIRACEDELLRTGNKKFKYFRDLGEESK